MKTLTSADVAVLLVYLDGALADARQADAEQGIGESHAVWCIQSARALLISAKQRQAA